MLVESYLHSCATIRLDPYDSFNFAKSLLTQRRRYSSGWIEKVGKKVKKLWLAPRSRSVGHACVHRVIMVTRGPRRQCIERTESESGGRSLTACHRGKETFHFSRRFSDLGSRTDFPLLDSKRTFPLVSSVETRRRENSYSTKRGEREHVGVYIRVAPRKFPRRGKSGYGSPKRLI